MTKIRSTNFFLISILIPNLIYSQNPGTRDHLGFAYFPPENAIILYGGSSVDNSNKYTWNADTWMWNHDGWKNQNNGTPGSITSQSMIYAGDGKILMIGGVNPAKGDLDETWLWDGSGWELHEGAGPGARLSPAIVYDKKREEVVLFSGCIGNHYLPDTWIWKNNAWEKISDSGPQGRCRAAMFFDEVKGNVLLFGGVLSEGSEKFPNDLWEWDGQKWSKMDQGILVPSGRSNIQIAYDSNRKRAVLYGGSSDGVLNDLWEWDGKSWQKIKITGESPGNLEVYGITYHQQDKKIYIYGGRSGFARPTKDFWSWDGKNFRRVNTDN